MAAWMLRNGDDPDRVAAVTDVPFALVELIAEHLPPPAAVPRRPGLPTDHAPGGRGLENDAGSADPRGDHTLARAHAQQSRQRRILSGAVIYAMVNAALGMMAVLVHADTVAAVCLTLMPTSFAIVLALQLLLPPRTPPRHRRC